MDDGAGGQVRREEQHRWTETSRKSIAHCKVFEVMQSICASPTSGNRHSFYVIESADWVNVVPLTRRNELVCVRQYRHGAGKITLEVPGGMVDADESPEAAARRECLEETGFQIERLESLGVYSPNSAIFRNKTHSFVARDARWVNASTATDTEQTEVVLIPFAQIEPLLLAGMFDHALVALSLWRLVATANGARK